MLNKITRTLKITFLLSFVFFTSCEKDLYQEPIKASKVKTVSLSSLPNLQQAITQKREALKKTNKEGETDYLSLILPDKVKMIEGDNGSTSYTFGLNLDEDKKLTNLVVKQLGEDYYYELVEYTNANIDKWKYEMEKFGKSSINPTVNLRAVSGGSDFGLGCIQVMSVCPSGIHSTYGVGHDPRCDYDISTWTIEIDIDFNCLHDQGASSSANGGGSGSVGGGGSGSGTSDTPPVLDHLDTTPIVHLTPSEKSFLAFINGLDQEQQDFLNDENNSDTRDSIKAFLMQNDFNSQSTSFVNQMITLCINNGSTFSFDNSVNSSNGQVFSNVTEFENYLNSISVTPTFEDFEENSNQNGHKAYFKFKLNSISKVIVIANVIDNTNGTSTVNSATTEQSGIYVMSEWHQGGDASIAALPNGNVKIVVVGAIKSSAVVDAIGFSFSTSYELTAVYNPNNGIIVSTTCIKL